jgi:hypothetical protein
VDRGVRLPGILQRHLYPSPHQKIRRDQRRDRQELSESALDRDQLRVVRQADFDDARGGRSGFRGVRRRWSGDPASESEGEVVRDGRRRRKIVVEKVGDDLNLEHNKRCLYERTRFFPHQRLNSTILDSRRDPLRFPDVDDDSSWNVELFLLVQNHLVVRVVDVPHVGKDLAHDGVQKRRA